MIRSAVLLVVGAAWLGAAFGAVAAEPASAAPTFKLTRMVQKLPVGAQWLRFGRGLGCATDEVRRSDGTQIDLDVALYQPLFERELPQLASVGASARPSLFGTAAPKTADYEIGGLVHGLELQVCYATMGAMGLLVGPLPIPGNEAGFNGTARMDVEWQVYSPSKREVVATIATSSVFELKRRQDDGVPALIEGVFVESFRQLGRSGQLTALRSSETAQGTLTRISLTPGSAGPRPLNEATGAVVLVMTDGGHGSGFLASRDGYLLTNAHVVGSAKHVKVRWSDGLETEGEVVRVHKERDVALVKTDGRGREPLSLRTGGAQAGETVLAIGAPLELALQGTVTRGVVSANRVLEGFSYVQSDVNVNPGNSGGPLVDEKGAVVAITSWGYRPEGVPNGINFFIPIKDAADFLKLDLAQQ